MIELEGLSIGGVITVTTFLTVIFIIISLVLTVVVLDQEGKSAGSRVVSG